MSNRDKRSKIVKIILVVFVVALVITAISFIARFTNNFTSDFKTFYVEYDGKTITTDYDGVVFVRGEQNRVNVGYSLGFFNKEKCDYSVSFSPNVTDDTDFEYTIGNEVYRFSEIDLSAYYKIEKYENYFTFEISKNLTEIFSDMKAQVPNLNERKNLLKLVVLSEDKSVSINLGFEVVILPTDLELDDSLLFW